MNRPLMVVACTLLSVALAAQTVLYVSPQGTGDGSSWKQATSLHQALDAALPGTTLWLASGTYSTSATANREESFLLPSGVRILGGFSGSETHPSNRDPERHRVVLSGEIGTDDRHDNAYTILSMASADAQTTVDGVTFRGAYANGHGPVADSHRAGGAVLISLAGPGQATAPVFTDCIFENNFARDGAAVYVDGSGGRATPSFVACTFRQNEADLDGGAIYNDGRLHGEASPILSHCVFESNEANYGAAIFNQATKGQANPRLSNCTFRQNKAYVRGTTLYNIDHQGTSRPLLVDCAFEDLKGGRESSDDLARSNQ